MCGDEGAVMYDAEAGKYDLKAGLVWTAHGSTTRPRHRPGHPDGEVGAGGRGSAPVYSTQGTRPRRHCPRRCRTGTRRPSRAPSCAS